MASSSLVAAARRLLRLGRGRSGLLPGFPPRAAASAPRGYSTENPRPALPLGLQSALYPLGHPRKLLVPEIELWAARPGNRLRHAELQLIVKELRNRRRHRQALEISEWMNAKGHVKFLPGDHAVHLDLVGEVHGVEAAETYFNHLSEKDKTEKTHGALLKCYTRELLVDKALAHFQKMKELGLLFSPLSYNNIMSLYTDLGQHEKVPSVLAEMKSNGIIPDKFSYRICINSYGTKADFFGMENTLKEMKCEPQIDVDWKTYAAVASNYIKGLREKAYSALKKAEAKINKTDSDAYNYLISLYSQLGDRSEVKRLWALQMSNCKGHSNKDYTTMLAKLVKLDEISEAEALLKEWESSGNTFDFNVPNILLTGYRQKGLLDKAEMLLDNFLKKGKMPPSISWGIVAIGYAEKGDAGKTYELTKNALRVYTGDSDWIPRSSMIEMILEYLGNKAELKDVETFVDLLKVAVPMNSEMTKALSRARARGEKKAEEETTEALSSEKKAEEEMKETLSSKKVQEERTEALSSEKKVEEETTEALRSEKKAEEEMKEALSSEKKAEEETTEALCSEKMAEEEMKEALSSEKKAEEETTEALCSEKMAEEETTEALCSKKKAEEERTEALSSEKKAEEEMKEALSSEKKAEKETKEALSSEKKAEEEMKETLSSKKVQEERTEALSSEKKAEEERTEALSSEKKAEEETTEALSSEKKAEEETTEALCSEKMDEEETTEALCSEKMAEEETTEALCSKKKAEEERTEALSSEKKAEEEMKEALSSVKKAEKETKEALSSEKKAEEQRTKVLSS